MRTIRLAAGVIAGLFAALSTAAVAQAQTGTFTIGAPQKSAAAAPAQAAVQAAPKSPVAVPALAAVPVAGPTATLPPGAAQAPGAAQTPGRPYEVNGFRSARFGMSDADVRAVAASDFGIPSAEIKRVSDPVNGTSALVTTTKSLEPGPGAATITYIFGKQSQRLMHVNVVWLIDADRVASGREQVLAAGLRLSQFLKLHSWRGNLAVEGVPIGPNSITMFVAKDAAGGTVEVRADGVGYSRDVNGREEKSPPPTGPARLRISYGQNTANPDIARIEPGKF